MQVHTDVTIGDVVPPILGQAMDQEGTGQASHIGSMCFLKFVPSNITIIPIYLSCSCQCQYSWRNLIPGFSS